MTIQPQLQKLYEHKLLHFRASARFSLISQAFAKKAKTKSDSCILKTNHTLKRC